MPLPIDLDTTVTSVDELSRLASRFMAEFEERLTLERPFDVSFVLHQTRFGLTSQRTDQPRPTMVAKKGSAGYTLHLYGPDLVGIPVSALQGGLYLELAAIALGRRKDEFQFNFSREILPLINVSGTALQVIRYLLFHLEAIVKQVRAVQLVLDMAHGLPLCAYYYLTISPSNEDRGSYANLVPHHWTRAIFICKKCKEHGAVSLLAHQGIFAELETYWWACHQYILPEDKRLMEKLADISCRFNRMRFSEQMVALFETVKADLLI